MSRAVVIAAGVVAGVLSGGVVRANETHVYYDELVKEQPFGGKWNDKGGQAVKFKYQGSDYRMYRPTRSATKPDRNGKRTTTITTKVEHIRNFIIDPGAKDDYALLTLEFDDETATLLTLRVEVVLAGAPQLDVGLVKDLAGQAGEKEKVAAEAAAKALNSFSKWIADNGEKGGRKQFRVLLEKHIVNNIVKHSH
jgi:hypothetical protein